MQGKCVLQHTGAAWVVVTSRCTLLNKKNNTSCSPSPCNIVCTSGNWSMRNLAVPCDAGYSVHHGLTCSATRASAAACLAARAQETRVSRDCAANTGQVARANSCLCCCCVRELGSGHSHPDGMCHNLAKRRRPSRILDAAAEELGLASRRAAGRRSQAFASLAPICHAHTRWHKEHTLV
jgi:hypothetical protein